MATKEPSKTWRRHPHYYWWTLANTLAVCVAVLSWLLTLHIFRHPEIPRYYRLITKLGITLHPAVFDMETAPPGEAANPGSLYRRYAQLDATTLRRLNNALLRNYMTQFKEQSLVQYVEGQLQVIRTHELDSQDLFSPGFVVRGRAMVQPDEFSKAAPWPVIIDCLFPTEETAARQWFKPGEMMKLSKIPNYTTVLNVQREIEGDAPRVVITVAPIVMGEYELDESRHFRLHDPTFIRPRAEFPIFEPEP